MIIKYIRAERYLTISKTYKVIEKRAKSACI